MRNLLSISLTLVLLMAPLSAQQVAVPGEAAALEALYRCAVMVNLEEDENSKGETLRERYGADFFACGSGVLLDRGRQLVTNLHVAGRKTTREVVRELTGTIPNRKRVNWVFRAHPAARGDWSEAAFLRDPRTFEKVRTTGTMQQSQLADVMVFAVADAHWPGIDRYIRSSDLRPGTTLYTLGNANGIPWTVASGAVVSVWQRGNTTNDSRLGEWFHRVWAQYDGPNRDLRTERYNSLLFTTPLSQPGNSGGPVVDEHGRLAGICFAGSSEISILIPTEEIFRALRREAPSTSPPLGVSTSTITAGSAAPDVPLPPSQQDFNEVQEKLDSGEFTFSLGAADDSDTTPTLRR